MSNSMEQIAPFVECSCKNTVDNFLSVSVGMYPVIAYIISCLLYTSRHTTANINIISTKQSSLESAYRQIIEYFNSDIDCSKIAKSIGYSYDRFRHLFKERFGLSVKQMIIAKRMDNAKILLCTTDLTVSEIASACGYKNVTQFCSTFRKTQGMAPIRCV